MGALLLLLLLEGGVRLLRPDIGPATTDLRLVRDSAFVDEIGVSAGLRPGAAGLSHGARLLVDADGFLAYAGNAGLADTTAAWLFLGDSVTMGIGVAPDSAFAGRLAARTDTLRILNPSLVGYAVDDYARLLDAFLADPTLDLARVTVAWCLNDVYPDAPSQEPGQAVRNRSGALTAALNKHSRLYRLTKAVALDRPLAYYQHDRLYYVDDDADPRAMPADALAAALDALEQMHARCTARGIRFDVALLPYEPQLRPVGTSTVEGERRPQEVLAARLRARGVPVTDLTPDLAAYGPSDALYLWSDGIHLSARGHAVVADALTRATL